MYATIIMIFVISDFVRIHNTILYTLAYTINNRNIRFIMYSTYRNKIYYKYKTMCSVLVNVYARGPKFY